MASKRHHFVPKTYLKYFCDEDGKIIVYRKDDPTNPLHQTPNNTAFHKYYYSQPLPDGGREDDALENVFSKLEDQWPSIVDQLLLRKDANDKLQDLFAFMAVQRLRVPATRDAVEQIYAERVLATARRLDATGKFPPKPTGLENIWEHVEVAIDPHRSILGMAEMLLALGPLFDRIGIGAYHNTTNLPLLTSDNPVIWFDPSVPESRMEPYGLEPDGPILLIFPVTPNLIIYGDTSMRPRFNREGLVHAELPKPWHVKNINRQICRFAYNTIFAQRPGHEALIRRHADVSPVLRTDIVPAKDGELLLHRYVFGPRSRKPKWNRRS